MNYKLKIIFLALVFYIAHISTHAQEVDTSSKATIAFEHIGINIEDTKAATEWYTKNLNMKIIRENMTPYYSAFIADSALSMMIELNYNKDFPAISELNFNYDSFHLAFCVDNINLIKERLLNAGATILSDIRKTESGDQVLVLRDPWGLSIQFVQRAKPMLNKKGIYFEHVAFNVEDSRAISKWYVDNLNMVVMREGKAPSYGMFVADNVKNMMFEFYQHKDSLVIDFKKLNHGSLHIAFSVSDIKLTKERILKAKAEVVNDIYNTPSGDSVLNVKDINGLPIQFVNRVNPMIK
ncbi:VOC family protein [Rosettibacter firmus]|uniref:VOC family protein n=1 Tax=Rosettibacter firmus TaxID=3111522 RepID=UPI00336C0510